MNDQPVWIRRVAGNILLRLGESAGARALILMNPDRTKVLQAQSDGDLLITRDLLPDGEASCGLFARLANRMGIAGYTDHFRSGVIPTGFSWISDGTFNGTPANLAYNFRSSYLRAMATATPYFLADAITVYADKVFYARLDTGLATEIGIRLDDGSDDNYAELILDPQDDGTYIVDFRYRAGGGAVTDVAGPQYPCTQMVVVYLCWVNATPAVYGYTLLESGDTVNVSGFNTGVLAWTPARVGIKLQVNAGNYAHCDWFYSTFE